MLYRYIQLVFLQFLAIVPCIYHLPAVSRACKNEEIQNWVCTILLEEKTLELQGFDWIIFHDMPLDVQKAVLINYAMEDIRPKKLQSRKWLGNFISLYSIAKNPFHLWSTRTSWSHTLPACQHSTIGWFPFCVLSQNGSWAYNPYKMQRFHY